MGTAHRIAQAARPDNERWIISLLQRDHAIRFRRGGVTAAFPLSGIVIGMQRGRASSCGACSLLGRHSITASKHIACG